MTVTLAQARTEVRSLLNEASPVYWTDAQLNNWVNQGCSDIARRAEILWQQVDISVSPLVQNYPFPADFLSCHRAEFTLGGTSGTGSMTYTLEYREVNTMDEVWGILHSLPAAWPQRFTIRGNTALGFFLQIYPVPGAAGLLTLDYYRQAAAATNDDQNLDLMSGWEDIVYDYAVYKAMRKNRDPAWQEAFQLYEGNLVTMMNRTRSMTDL